MERDKDMAIKIARSEEVVQDERGSSCAGETFEADDQTIEDHQPSHPAPLMEYQPSDLRLIATVAASSASKQMTMQAHSQDAAVLTVLGGKASCRRKFVLTLQLQDAQGHLVPRDLSIIASVAFANDHSPVRPSDTPGEPPLFTTFNGIEFSAHDNPTRMLAGHATFKLAISLLSSKYENRLFCICFSPQTKPPLCPPCFSSPIRSISRKRTSPAHLHVIADASHTDPSLFHLPQIHTPAHPFPTHSPNHSSSDNNNNNINSSTGDPHVIHSTPASQWQSMNCRRTKVGSADQDRHYHYDINAQESDAVRTHTSSVLQDDDRIVDHLPLLSNTRHSGASTLHQQNMMPQSTFSSSSTSTPGRSTIQNIATCRLNTPSPVDSGSPNSVTLTSESCIDNQFTKVNQGQYVSCLLHNGVQSSTTLQASMGRPLSAPSLQVSCARPLRPQASIGVCKLPFARSANMPHEVFHPLQGGGVPGAGANGIHASAGIGEGRHATLDLLEEAAELQSRSFVVGMMQHLSSAAALATPVRQRLDVLMRSFLGNGSSSSRRMCSSPFGEANHQNETASLQLEEEERAIHYLELSLYEVNMEIQKHKEEVRLKRRRLLEDEARLNNFIFKSSSWIN